VQVDVDPAALHRHQSVHAVVLGDAGAVAEAFVELLDEAEVKPTGFASPELADKLASRRDDDFTDLSADGHVDLRSAMLRIEEEFPRDRALVFDGGRWIFNRLQTVPRGAPAQLRAHRELRLHRSGHGQRARGAVGSQKPTLLVTGDGGFMLGGLAEFNTAVRHGLDLVVILFNDMAYGAEHIQFRNKDMDPAASTFDWPDFGPVADALGGKGYTVRTLEDLDAALAELPKRDRPVLIDIKIDPDKVTLAGH
jgi:acetolactate synthase-1/2/3 large subunit